MYLLRSYILIFLAFPIFTHGQNRHALGLGTGSDLCVNDSIPFSLHVIEEKFVSGTEVVFCPAGIKRSSTNDIKKRQSYNWITKYENIYLRNQDGIVFEGMNEYGFSASLVYHENCHLPDKEKQLIPIGVSLAVNFFIDHFKSVDTALLAVWDIRIFDDLGLDAGWPFRIILHDTSGATAYIEYVHGYRSVYTPDKPAFVVSGADYTHLIKLEYIPETRAETKVDELYLNIIHSAYPPNIVLLLLKEYIDLFPDSQYYNIFRYHQEKEMYIMTPDNDEILFNFREIEFLKGEELTTSFF